MNKKKLGTVTLLGIDCVDVDRLILAANICQEHFEFAEVKLLTSLPSDHPSVIKIDHIDSTTAYSEFVLKELDVYVDTEHVLVFQYDGFILNPNAWDDDFLKYDYIGAVWLLQDWMYRFGFPKELFGTMMVGNGGFSLRSKKLVSMCAQLARENKFEKYDPEDMAICYWKRKFFEENGMVFASIEVAKRFSFEGKTDELDKWTDQFGFHGFRWTDISNWTKNHPEYVLDVKNNTLKVI